MAITITVLNDANHTISISKPIIARQGELGEAVTVVVPVALHAAGRLAFVNFINPDGDGFVLGVNQTGFDYSSGSFTFNLGVNDASIVTDGELGIQIVLRAGTAPAVTYEWRSRILICSVEKSIMATVDALTGAVNPITYPLFPAKFVSIDDAGNRYLATNVEDALQELAGAGRTTETVKSAYDLAVATDAIVDVHVADASIHFTPAERAKLAGIEDGAEANNISDVNATDLTDGGNTTLHIHDSRYYTESEVDSLLNAKEQADPTILKEIDIGI